MKNFEHGYFKYMANTNRISSVSGDLKTETKN